jgi:hypothetical protein
LKNSFIKGSLVGLFTAVKAISALGQGNGPSGKVLAAGDSTKLPQATVKLMRPDSSVLETVVTNDSGVFAFKRRPPSDTFLLDIQHVTHERLMQRFTEYKPSLGTFVLPERAVTIGEVIVNADPGRPQLLGDTLVFNTAGLHLERYDKIKDLFARLQGVQVDADGNVTVNGQAVDRLLINGVETKLDSKLIIEYLNGSAVARVEFLEDKDQRAKFSGVDNGNRVKTLNLVLKKTNTPIYSGVVQAAANDQKYYDAGGFMTSIKDRKQMAGTLKISNIGYNPAFKGFSVATPRGSDPLGGSAGVGIPKMVGGAIQYANILPSLKPTLVPSSITGMYQYGHSLTEPVTHTLSEKILSGAIYRQQQASNSTNSYSEHAAQAEFESYHWLVSFTGTKRKGHNEYTSTTFGAFNDTLVNNSKRDIQSDVMGNAAKGNIAWRDYGRKRQGRAFSLMASFNINDNAAHGFLSAQNEFYQRSGAFLSADTLDQRKSIITKNNDLSVTAIFKDSLGKKAQWGLTYMFTSGHDRAVQYTYDVGNGSYEDRIDSLSNDYRNARTSHRTALTLTGKQGPVTLNLVAAFESNTHVRTDGFTSNILRYQYNQFLPQMKADWRINRTKILSFVYRGIGTQPSIQQLQPVKNNTDPLNQTLGNPDLRPAYNHGFEVYYQSRKAVQFQASTGVDMRTNDIGMRTLINDQGVQSSQPVNIRGATSAKFGFSVSQKIKSSDMNVQFNNQNAYTRSYTYINNELSANDIYNVGGVLNLNKTKQGKYSALLNLGVNYSQSRSSLRPDASVRYVTYNGRVNASYFPTKSLEISSDVQFSAQQKARGFDANTTRAIWNAHIKKGILKKKFSLCWSVFNILDQNNGVIRATSLNETTERITNTLGRYYMVTLAMQLDQQIK